VFEEWHLALIAEMPVARLATLNADGSPHLVPVCYAYLEGAFVIAVDEKPKRPGRLARLANLDRDPRATLLIDRYDDDWTRLAWLRVDCLAVIEEGGAQPAALAALRARYPRYAGMDLEARPLLRLQPRRARGWRWQETE
jgi:PPOX class probable F420-dependent enzyme